MAEMVNKRYNNKVNFEGFADMDGLNEGYNQQKHTSPTRRLIY
jgi:hypothetical protein